MSGESHFKETYNGTGEQPIIDINWNNIISFNVKTTGGAPNFDVQVVYKKDGDRCVSLASQTDTNVSKVINGPIAGIALNITTNPGTIVLEGRATGR
jgi:hypothetical protein